MGLISCELATTTHLNLKVDKFLSKQLELHDRSRMYVVLHKWEERLKKGTKILNFYCRCQTLCECLYDNPVVLLLILYFPKVVIRVHTPHHLSVVSYSPSIPHLKTKPHEYDASPPS